jgi:hypothetical protein
MNERKLRGPITLLCERRRLLWTVSVLLAIVILSMATVVIRTHFRGLRTRLSRVSVGMTREQIESIFGPPAVSLRMSTGNGEALYWADQLSQVEVFLDGDGRVIKFGSTPSRSALRRTVGRLIPLPN